MKKKLLTYLLMIVLLFGITGCGSDAEGGIQPVKKAGTVILSANASVMIDYDTDGLVMNIHGLNENGLNLAAQEEDLLRMPCLIAVHKLIVDINDAGFFTSDFGGEGREVYLYLQKGSTYHKSFLEALEKSILQATEECGLTATNLTTFDANEEHTELEEDMKLHHLYLAENSEDNE